MCANITYDPFLRPILFQLENDAGKWVKLSKDALNQFSCRGSEGYALAYNKEKKEAFLEDVEVSHHFLMLVTWM